MVYTCTRYQVYYTMCSTFLILPTQTQSSVLFFVFCSRVPKPIVAVLVARTAYNFLVQSCMTWIIASDSNDIFPVLIFYAQCAMCNVRCPMVDFENFKYFIYQTDDGPPQSATTYRPTGSYLYMYVAVTLLNIVDTWYLFGYPNSVMIPPCKIHIEDHHNDRRP